MWSSSLRREYPERAMIAPYASAAATSKATAGIACSIASRRAQRRPACTDSRSTPPLNSTLVMIDMRTASSRAATLSVISGSPSRRWMATFVSSRYAMPTGRRDQAVPHRRAARRTPHPWGGALPRLIKRAFQDVSRRTPRCGTTHSPAASPRSTAREHPRADVTRRQSRAPAPARSPR